MNPSDLYIKALSLPPDMKQEVLLLSHKMLILGFTASFEKVTEGPILRIYYFKPHSHATLGKIMSKEEDLAIAVGRESILIRRELDLVAISVPREPRQIISFQKTMHEFMLSPKAQEAELPMIIGRTASGELLWADLAKQPHILIGGATNSGKSIFVSQVICSLALMKPPSELRMSVVDTKQLDLTLFRELKHVRDVITDVNELRVFMQDTLALIRRRLQDMSGVARNIMEWNALTLEQMPYICIIIDELADVLDQDNMILAAFPKGQRPESIGMLLKRIAQISRAAGVHLIAATQRPSVDVIKGDTKTNFPSRIAFKLPTMQDSRVILDENGAERLLGMGDMLCKLAGVDTPIRAHSAFVTMRDILQITGQHEMIREQYTLMSKQLRISN